MSWAIFIWGDTERGHCITLFGYVRDGYSGSEGRSVSIVKNHSTSGRCLLFINCSRTQTIDNNRFSRPRHMEAMPTTAKRYRGPTLKILTAIIKSDPKGI